MQVPLELEFRGLDPSPEVEALVREEVERLERLDDRITRCRVAIEVPHRHHQKGNLHSVRVDVRMPGHEIVVNRAPGEDRSHRRLEVAIRDAFDAVQRRLEDVIRKRRGDVKEHAEQPHGEVLAVGAQGDHGFIRASDGRELYFHRNAVLHGAFDELEPGTPVAFVEEEGAKGPQASTVRVLGSAGKGAR